MQPSVKTVAAGLLRPVARRITANYGRILMYHRFGLPGEIRRTDIETFSRHLEVLRKSFRPRRLSEVVLRLRSGEALEPNTVVVTVDDGYADFFEHAVPILMRYEIPATVYIVSDFVSQETWLWFDAVHWLVQAAATGQYEVGLGIRSQVVRLASGDDRHTLWLLVAEYCLKLGPSAQWAVVERLEQALGVMLPKRPPSSYAAMTWQQVQDLDRSLFEVGAHTCSHVVLSRCTLEQQRQEIGDCKRRIEERTGRVVEAFCYPNGMREDFDDDTVGIVQELGFTSAVMAQGGLVGRASDLLRLERLAAPEDLRLFENAVSGLWHLRDLVR